MLSSQETDNSQIIIFLLLFENIIRSGRSVVCAIWLRNISCLRRSVNNFQSGAVKSIFGIFFSAFDPFSRAFIKYINFSLHPVLNLHVRNALMTPTSIATRTWSCRQRYRPSPKALEQLLEICCKVAFYHEVSSWACQFSPMCVDLLDLGERRK